MDSRSQPSLEEMEFLEMNCPWCQAGVDFLVDLAGTAQGCPNCGESLVVPRRPGDSAGTIPLPMKGVNLTLRRLDVEDWKGLMSFWDEVDDASLCQWLKEQATDKLTQEGKVIYLGLEEAKEGALLGNFTLGFLDPSHRQARFDVATHPERMTDNLFREACSTLFVLCFKGMNLHRLIIEGPATRRRLEGRLRDLGMRKEGNYLKDRFEDGVWHDSFLYAFLQEDYQRRIGDSK